MSSEITVREACRHILSIQRDGRATAERKKKTSTGNDSCDICGMGGLIGTNLKDCLPISRKVEIRVEQMKQT